MMYKQHLQNTKDVERQMEEVVRDMGSVIEMLTSQLEHIGIDTVTSTLQKLKTNNEKLNEVIKKLVTKNKQLEDTIKSQAAKINFLESNIARMKTDMKASKDSQAEVNKDLQTQIDQLKRMMTASDSKVEQKMSSIVTTVMAAQRFKNALKNRGEGKSAMADKQDKLKPQ